MKVTAQLQRLDSSRHSLSLGELLRFRRQVIAHNMQLYNSLNYLRGLNVNNVADLDSANAVAIRTRRLSLLYGLRKNQAASLDVLDAIQQDLATLQLRYLQQPGQQASLLAAYRRELALLQLSDAQAQKLKKPDLPDLAAPDSLPSRRPSPDSTTLMQQKLALVNTLELQQGEASTKRDGIARQLLDSCHRELHLLRWLDSCRAQQDYLWHRKGSLSNFSKEDLRNYYESIYTRAKLLPRWQWQNYFAFFVLGLVALLPLVLAGYGWYQTRQGLQQAKNAPAQQREPMLLQLLLLAYADHIRALLRTPRQIKRFVGKVRLQHHLLGSLAQGQGRTRPFSFGPAEQVLAFVLLLLIEENAHVSSQQLDEAAFTKHLREAYPVALAAGHLNAAVTKRFAFWRGKVWLRPEPNTAAKAPLLVFGALLPEDTSFLNSNQAMLLKQLYWLNAGLLV
ncbi:hypothetical protein ACW9KT_09050 [Hymenobacter sp. HD11105]